MKKYPVLPCIIITLLLAAACYVIWSTVSGQLLTDDVTVDGDANTAVTSGSKALPVPVAVAIVQVCGLFMTVMLAFFPIQSAAFHQGKKAILDELLELLTRYEDSIAEISNGVFKHQTACGVDDFKESRALLSTKQKISQSLRDRIGAVLPVEQREMLENESKLWWGSMFGEQGWATSKTKSFKNQEAYCEQMLQTQSRFIGKLGELRMMCLFDEIRYWQIKRK